MNVRHLVPSVSRRLLSVGYLILAASLHYASGQDLSKFKRIEPQFIAALGDPGPPPAMARNHGASGTRIRARALASWTTSLN